MINFFFLALWSHERAFACYSTEQESSRICHLCHIPSLPAFKHYLFCGPLTEASTAWVGILDRETAPLTWDELLSWIADCSDPTARLRLAVQYCFLRWVVYTRIVLHLSRNPTSFPSDFYASKLQYLKVYPAHNSKKTDKYLSLVAYLNDEFAWDAKATLGPHL